MRLKRIYKTDGAEQVLVHIAVSQYKKNQNFSQKFVDKCIEDGFLSISSSTIVFDTMPKLTYKIVSTPGIYCCFDNKKMDDEQNAIDYIEQNYAGQDSPDLNNPRGYRDDRFYRCELMEENYG